MSTTPPDVGEARTARLRATARFLVVVLAVAAVVLSVLVWRAVAGDPTTSADPGEVVALGAEPYGKPLTVLLPGSEITLVVGDPVDTLDHELLGVEYDDPRYADQQDLAAPDDGVLVPLSWRTRALGGFARRDDPNPIAIRLVAGDQRVDLTTVVLDGTSASLDAFDTRSAAVGVRGDLDATDLAIEVDYDGLTQTADVASGEIDAGVAQALYDGNRNFTAPCGGLLDSCELTAADPASPVRPHSATFTADYLTLYPYDSDLGWADDGTLWAAVRLQFFGADSVRNAAGRSWLIAHQSAPAIPSTAPPPSTARASRPPSTTPTAASSSASPPTPPRAGSSSIR